MIFPGFFLRHAIHFNLSPSDDLILTEYAILTALITVLIEIPFVWSMITTTETTEAVFRSLVTGENSSQKPAATMKLMYLRSGDENAQITSAFNQFITNIWELSKDISESMKKSEDFFRFISQSLKDISDTAVTIADSMQHVSQSSQTQTDLVLTTENQLAVVKDLQENLILQSQKIKSQISELSFQL